MADFLFEIVFEIVLPFIAEIFILIGLRQIFWATGAGLIYLLSFGHLQASAFRPKPVNHFTVTNSSETDKGPATSNPKKVKADLTALIGCSFWLAIIVGLLLALFQ